MLAEAGHAVVGVDINAAAIEAARRNATGLQTCQEPLFVVASALAMPFKDGSFGGAYAFEVLEHIWPVDQFAVHKGLQRLLRQSGCLVATVPMERGCYNETHVMFFTPELLRSMCVLYHWRVRFCSLVSVPETHGGGQQIALMAQPSCYFRKRV